MSKNQNLPMQKDETIAKLYALRAGLSVIAENMEQSLLGRMGKAVEPVFALQGFNWKLDVSLLAGVGAKEIVASTMGILYAGEDMLQQMTADGLTPLTAYAYLLFILLYFPCLATIVAIKHETSSWRWAIFAACYTTVVAWVVSALVVQLGNLFLP